MLHQIVYTSASPIPDAPVGIQDILDSSRRNNARDAITGVLLFASGSFLQVLEGPEPAVDARFQVIRQDPRHLGVLPLIEREIETRMFADWSMGWYRCPPGHPAAGLIQQVSRPDALLEPGADSELDTLIRSIGQSLMR